MIMPEIPITILGSKTPFTVPSLNVPITLLYLNTNLVIPGSSDWFLLLDKKILLE